MLVPFRGRTPTPTPMPMPMPSPTTTPNQNHFSYHEDQSVESYSKQLALHTNNNNQNFMPTNHTRRVASLVGDSVTRLIFSSPVINLAYMEILKEVPDSILTAHYQASLHSISERLTHESVPIYFQRKILPTRQFVISAFPPA